MFTITALSPEVGGDGYLLLATTDTREEAIQKIEENHVAYIDEFVDYCRYYDMVESDGLNTIELYISEVDKKVYHYEAN